ncbi:MAG: dienelactone hydrolase family protein [Alphaproteobacteria bacterium]
MVDGSAMEMMVASPAGAGPHPGIVVMCHRPGLDGFTAEITDLLAADGFKAAAPDIYHRLPPEQDTSEKKFLVRDSEIIADIAACAEFLKSDPDVDAARLAILGHCMGGRMAFLGASALDDFRGVSVFYGGNLFKCLGDDGPTPFDRLADIHCPVAGFFGNEDNNPSPADVMRVDAELTRLGIAHEFHRYDGVGHGFHQLAAKGGDDATTRRCQAVVAEAWGRSGEFLRACFAA